ETRVSVARDGMTSRASDPFPPLEEAGRESCAGTAGTAKGAASKAATRHLCRKTAGTMIVPLLIKRMRRVRLRSARLGLEYHHCARRSLLIRGGIGSGGIVDECRCEQRVDRTGDALECARAEMGPQTGPPAAGSRTARGATDPLPADNLGARGRPGHHRAHVPDTLHRLRPARHRVDRDLDPVRADASFRVAGLREAEAPGRRVSRGSGKVRGREKAAARCLGPDDLMILDSGFWILDCRLGTGESKIPSPKSKIGNPK